VYTSSFDGWGTREPGKKRKADRVSNPNPLTSIERRNIEVLVRRRDHLRRRIKSSPVDLSYDRTEACALEWAVKYIAGKEATHGR
jgi:hypothetical protein